MTSMKCFAPQSSVSIEEHFAFHCNGRLTENKQSLHWGSLLAIIIRLNSNARYHKDLKNPVQKSIHLIL